MCAVEMKNDESDKNSFVDGHRLASDVRLRGKNTLQIGLGEKFFPYLPMVRGDLKEVRDSSRRAVALQRYAGKKEAANNRDGLQTGEPILLEPVHPTHATILARRRVRGNDAGKALFRFRTCGGALSPLQHVAQV